jgi:hypothetical protein
LQTLSSLASSWASCSSSSSPTSSNGVSPASAASPHIKHPIPTDTPPDYQNAKKAYQSTAKLPANSKYSAADLDRGFAVNGLWSWSRHPNFAAEQAIWVVLYQWACYATDNLVNWTFAGAFAYLLLFQGSTWLTELITAQKYPEYAEYQRLVGKFVPRLLNPKAAPASAPEPKAVDKKKK